MYAFSCSSVPVKTIDEPDIKIRRGVPLMDEVRVKLRKALIKMGEDENNVKTLISEYKTMDQIKYMNSEVLAVAILLYRQYGSNFDSSIFDGSFLSVYCRPLSDVSKLIPDDPTKFQESQTISNNLTKLRESLLIYLKTLDEFHSETHPTIWKNTQITDFMMINKFPKDTIDFWNLLWTNKLEFHVNEILDIAPYILISSIELFRNIITYFQSDNLSIEDIEDYFQDFDETLKKQYGTNLESIKETTLLISDIINRSVDE